MNFIKTNKTITILMFAAYAGACYGAAQSEQRSWWQRTKDFVSEYPIATGAIGAAATAGAYELAACTFGLPTLDRAAETAIEKIQANSSLWHCTKDVIAAYPIATGVIGTAAAAGAYELTARSLGLSTLNTVAGAALEKIKTDKECQISVAGILATGAYSIIAERFGLPTVTDIVKADLIKRSREKNENPACVYHLLHGVRVFLYGWYLESIRRRLGLYSLQDNRGTEQTVSKNSLLDLIIVGPLTEELICTYIPRWGIENNRARIVMPVIFGLVHRQYGVFGMMSCAMRSFLRHHSVCMRPEYVYSPIISHVVHNAVAVYLYYARNS